MTIQCISQHTLDEYAKALALREDKTGELIDYIVIDPERCERLFEFMRKSNDPCIRNLMHEAALQYIQDAPVAEGIA